MDRRHPVKRRALGLSLTLVSGAGCTSYPAHEAATDALRSDQVVTVEHVDDFTAFIPSQPQTDHTVIFYPGAKVDHEAYAPLLRMLAQEGVASVLVKMPGDLAVLAPNKGDDAIEAFSELGPWFAAGHSLGGAMAASWFADRLSSLEGLVLMAAYPAESVDLSKVAHPVVSVTASEDAVLDWDVWDERRSNLPSHTQYVDIEGGNHAGFGAYGPQDDDGVATICPEAQWEQTVAAMYDLVTQAD